MQRSQHQSTRPLHSVLQRQGSGLEHQQLAGVWAQGVLAGSFSAAAIVLIYNGFILIDTCTAVPSSNQMHGFLGTALLKAILQYSVDY